MSNVKRRPGRTISKAAPTGRLLGARVDADTEALTRRGWLRYSDLRPGDDLRTLNPETGMSEWGRLEHVQIHNGRHEVRHIDARSHSSVTSLDHNWITRDYQTGHLRFRQSYELNTADLILRAAPPADLPSTGALSDALVELLAWFWTEGHVRADGAVQIYQSERMNPGHCRRIRAAMIEHFGEPAVTLTTGKWRCPGWIERVPTVRKGVIEWYMNHLLGATLTDLAPGRVVRSDVLAEMTLDQLILFIDRSVDADGHTRREDGDRSIAQKSRLQLDAAETACALAGIPTTRNALHDRRFDRHSWQLHLGKQDRIRPAASAARRGGRRSTDITRMHRGAMWAPETANQTWLARRRGTTYYTGAYRIEGQLTLPLWAA